MTELTLIGKSADISKIGACVWIHKTSVSGTWSQFPSLKKAIEWASLYSSIHYKKPSEKLTTVEIVNLFNSGEILVEFLKTRIPNFKIYIYLGIFEPLTTSPKRSTIEYINLSPEEAINFSGDKTPYKLPVIKKDANKEPVNQIVNTPPLKSSTNGLKKIKSQHTIHLS